MLQYQNTRASEFQDWHLSQDGKDVQGIIITTRFAEVPQLHYVSRPGGYRKQLTFYSERIAGATSCPNPKLYNGLIYTKDVGGNENYQLYYFDFDTAKSVLLTDGISKNGSVCWTKKGDSFAFHSTKRNKKDYDIYLASPVEGQEPKLILECSGQWSPIDFDSSGQFLLLKRFFSIEHSELYVLNLSTSQLVQINPKSTQIHYGAALFHPLDSNTIFLTSDEHGEFVQLYQYSLLSHSFPSSSSITSSISWDVCQLDVSKTGQFLAFEANEEGLSQIYIYQVSSRQIWKIPNLPLGIAYSLKWHPDEKHLGLVLNTPQTPGDVYTVNTDKESKEEHVRWTFSEVGGLNTNDFVVPELIKYKSFDGREIPAFYYKPKKAKYGNEHKGEGKEKGDSFPMQIRIHGGPESQFRPQFIWAIQYSCVEMQIGVICPNIRGSSGYGKQYLLLDNGMLREDSIKDIGSLIEWCKERKDVDKDRIFVNGGSYGGYVVLASMIHFGESLRAGIERVGISNFVTFLENTAEYRRDLRRVEYGDERIPEMREYLTKISPLTRATEIHKPMLIAQGKNDPRVPCGESEQVVQAVRNNNVQCWYILAKDEGHGFVKKVNQDFYSTAEVLFIQQHILN